MFARTDRTADAARLRLARGGRSPGQRSRKLLLGSTALVAVSLATPAAAQVTLATPAQGGTITAASASGTTVNNQTTATTATSGGLTMVLADAARPTSINAITINNSTGNPNADALHLSAAGNNTVGLQFYGASNLTTTQSGGAALYETSGANVYATFNADGSALTGSYGINASAPVGQVGIINNGYAESFVANGSAIAGIYVRNVGFGSYVQLGTSTISGFATGVDYNAAPDFSFTSTGGSISASGTGISAVSTGAGITVSSASAITAPTGISAAGSTGAIVTTTGGGTINGTTAGTGTGILASASGGNLTVTVGAAIGGTTAFQTGVDARNTGSGTISVTNTAAINASNIGIFATNASVSNSGSISGTGGAGVALSGGTLTNNLGGTITSNNVAIGNSSAALTVINNGTLTGGVDAVNTYSALNLTNTGLIHTTEGAGSAGGVYINATGTSSSVTNSGTITGGTDATYGYGIDIDNGALTVTNQSGGTISGGTGAIRLATADAATINLNAGSTVTGQILSINSGDRTLTVAGTITGNYNAGTGTGANTFTLASTGSMQGATFGTGADTFNWNGGTIAGALDGGTGGTLNTLKVALGAGVSRTLNGLTNFFSNSNAVTSGTLTVTGPVSNVSGFAISGGGKLIYDTSFATGGQTIALLNAGGTLQIAAGRTITDGNVVSQTGTLLNDGTLTGNPNGGNAQAYDGVVVSNSGITATNTGSIVHGDYDYSTGFWLRGGTNQITNSGTISGGALNNTLITDGVRVESGIATVTNASTGIIYGGEGGIVTFNSGGITLSNSGIVVGAGSAITAGGTGVVNITNNAGGTIGTGTVDNAGVFTAGGNGNAINLISGTVTNAGTIDGAAGGVVATGSLTLTNTGTITSHGTGTGNFDGVTVVGTANILNSGTITGGGYAAIYTAAGGTITNAAAGQLIGAGSAAMVLDGGGTFNNYGSATNPGGAGVASGNANATVNLFAGSSTGSVTLGGGNDTLAIYNGRGTSGAATVDGPSGITLQNAGTLAAAQFGAIDMGGGTNTLMLRGGGDGTPGNGAAGSFAISTSTGASILTKADSGTWTLTGAAITPGITINAGTGGASGSGGLLVFNGTTGLTGTINVNGGTIRALTSGAFGTGTINAIDPTIQYGATGTYANNISLQSANPNTDPTVLQTFGTGITARLTGLISQSGAAAQPLVFRSTDANGVQNSGTFELTNGANDYAGLTTIETGTTVVERNVASALGSGGVTVQTGAVLQIDNQTGSSLFLDRGTYGGAGTLRFSGNAGSVTYVGVTNNVTTISLASGGLIDVVSGTVNGSSNNSGFWTGNLGSLNIASGAQFDTVEGTVRVDALTGAGTLRGGFAGTRTITVGVANGSGTFTGLVANGLAGGSVLALAKTGTGTQTLVGHNSYTGGTQVLAGTLVAGTVIGSFASDALGVGTVAISSGATVQYVNPYSTGTPGPSNAQIYVSNNTFIGAGNLVFTGGTGSLTVLDRQAGTANVAMSVGGLIDVQSGAVLARGSNVFAGNQASLNLASGTAFDGAANIVIDRLTGSGSYVGNGSLTLGVANGSATFNGTIGDENTGGGAILTLTKSGTGTQTLTGINTYTGATTISGGTLALSGTGSIASSSGVTNNATFDISGHTGGTSIVNLTGTASGATTTLGANTLTLTNASGSYAGNVTGTGALALAAGSETFSGALSNTGGLTLNGTSAATITSTGLASLVTMNGTTSLTNSGTISAAANAVFGALGGNATINNLAGGLITVSATSANAINAQGSLTLNNAGTISGPNATGNPAVYVNGAASIINSGTISAAGAGIRAFGAGASITNSGAISGVTAYAVAIDAGGSLTNSGSLIGGSDATLGYGVVFGRSDGNVLFTNQSGGTVTGGVGSIKAVGAGTITIDLQAGSSATGNVVSLDGGARSLTVNGRLNGAYDASAGTGIDTVVLGATGSIGDVLLGAGNDTLTRFAGSTASGNFNGGAGTDTLVLTGTGSATQSLANVLNFETLTKTGSGTWTLTGATGSAAATINAGTGGAPGSAGTLFFNGTTGLTGAIFVNGAAVQVSGNNALGTGVVHMVDPNITFVSTSTIGNAISLDVATVASGSPSNTSNDPSTFSANAGVVGTLTGAITTGSGNNANGYAIDPNQPVVIGGAGTIVLTNAGNSWTGTTTINSGATLRGTVLGISGGTIVDNGALNYNATSGTVSKVISGSGTLLVDGGSNVILTAANTYAGLTTINGSTLQIGNGGTTGSIVSNVVLANAGVLTFNRSNNPTYSGTIGGNGTVNVLGSATLTGAVTASNGVFVGANSTATLSNVSTNSNAITVNGDNATVNIAAGGNVTSTNGSGVSNFSFTGATINNGGTIASSPFASVYFGRGANTLNNLATGTVGGASAFYASANATASTVVNAGSISSAGSAIYADKGTLNVTNLAGGSIAAPAGNFAIYSAGGALTLLNSGSITGAIQSLGAFADAVTLNAGSTTTGNIFLDAGNDTLTYMIGANVTGGLNGGTGTDALIIDGAGTATLANSRTGFETLTKNGSGTVTLTGSDIGTLSVAINSGTLNVNNAAGAIDDAAAVTVAAGANFGVLANERVGSLNGAGNVLLGANTLFLGTNDLSSTFSGVASGTGGITQTGTGTLTLSGANTYTGTTFIFGGTLAFGASNVLADTSTLFVQNGTVNLGANSDTIDHFALFGGTLNGSGTLTSTGASGIQGYTVANATLNANLGTGSFGTGSDNVNTIVNGTVAAGIVESSAGTLTLGASNRFADTATVYVDRGSILDLQGFSDTVGSLQLQGTLNGTGTLTATNYFLTAGVVNANLGTGSVFVNRDFFTGDSVTTLNGTSAAGTVQVNANASLLLGASNRLADNAAVTVASGGILNLGAFNDTVGSLLLLGSLNGTGTLTAATYALNGATVNANLGTGSLFQIAGTSVLNGTSAAANVNVNAGTLRLGASNRLADNATVAIATGATLDLAAFSDTVGIAAINGILNGTGTLTAAQYQLNGATVNAILGAGTLFQLGGVSLLNGTAAAGNVSVNAGTLRLGAANRLVDNATVTINSGATLDLQAFNDTVGLSAINGTLNGTGTLTAGEYDLNGATVNANLGAGNLFQLGGVSLLNGTAGAANVMINGGTLRLGAAERLSDSAALAIASGGVLDLAGFQETVGTAFIAGSLNGTGTLVASQYVLAGGTVNANLGAGPLFNQSGISTLNGASAASTLGIVAGTLRLGASERLNDKIDVIINSGGVLDLNGFQETIDSLDGGGSVGLGAGRLRVGADNGSSSYAGVISGSGSFEKLGTGLFVYGNSQLYTGGTTVTAGELRLLGTTAGNVTVNAGTFSGGGTINGRLSLAGGTIAPGTGTGTFAGFQSTTFTSTAGNFAVDVSPTQSDFLIVTGAATLNGGLVQTNITAPSSQFQFRQLYTVLQAGSLTGTFANPTSFVQTSTNSDLYQRLRYDLAANSVVLEIRKMVDFAAAAGSPNQSAVGAALNSTRLGASDNFAGLLNAVGQLTPAQQSAALDALGNEGVADSSIAIGFIADRFVDLIDNRMDGTDRLLGNGNDAFGGQPVASSRTMATIGQALSLTGGHGGGAAGTGPWMKAYGFNTRLDGTPGIANLRTNGRGFAFGLDGQVGNLVLGGAVGVVDFDAATASRATTTEGTAWQGGLYARLRSGGTFAGVSGTYIDADYDTSRAIQVGALTGTAHGNASARAWTAEAVAGHDFALSSTAQFGVLGTVRYSDIDQRAYAELGNGVFNLNHAAERRQYEIETAVARASNTFAMGTGVNLTASVRGGVAFAQGDLTAALRSTFAGAPAGTGAFSTTGASLPSSWGLVGAGLNLTPQNNRWEVSLRYEGRYGSRLAEHQVALGVGVRW